MLERASSSATLASRQAWEKGAEGWNQNGAFIRAWLHDVTAAMAFGDYIGRVGWSAYSASRICIQDLVSGESTEALTPERVVDDGLKPILMRLALQKGQQLVDGLRNAFIYIYR